MQWLHRRLKEGEVLVPPRQPHLFSPIRGQPHLFSPNQKPVLPPLPRVEALGSRRKREDHQSLHRWLPRLA